MDVQFPCWDPVLFDIPFLPIDLRWYGLMYVVAFVFAQWAFTRLARSGFFPVSVEAAPDLIFYCVFGVMLGGRTGYALFYDQSLLNPLQFVQVWKGGLAFHGGLAGVGVAVWLFCRKYRLSWARTVDACALAVTPGILAVRIANFVNGELYGREVPRGTFGAMQFPTDPRALDALGIRGDMSMRARELLIQVAAGKREWADDVQQILQQEDPKGHWVEPAKWADVMKATLPNGEPLVPFRHPSQLYEGLGEGLVLGLVLLGVYLATRRRPLAAGKYAAFFLLGYAAIRYSLEFVRKPDEQFLRDGHDGTVLFGMTMGQTLSAALVLWALLILFWPRRKVGVGPATAP